MKTSCCNNLLPSFSVFTTLDHSDYSRKDLMNPAFPSHRTVARDAVTSYQSFLPQKETHCYELYIRPSCDPVLSIQPTPSFCCTSENSSSIHDGYTGRVLSNTHKPSSDQHSPCWDTPHSTAFSHTWPQDIKWKKFPANFSMIVGLHEILKWVQCGLLQ